MTLEQKIADLNSANTHLVREVLGTKARAQVAADAAAQHAERSTAEATKAAQHKADAERASNLADQAEAAAKHAENNAVAAVSGGTAASEPEAGKMPMADSEGLIANGWMLAVPSRAEFEARQETNRQLYAGSGFVNMGRSYKGNENVQPVPGNFGISAYLGVPNQFRLGYRNEGSTSIGAGPGMPLVHVDGVLLAIRGAQNSYDNSVAPGESQISLPDAPVANNLVTNPDFAGRVDITATADPGNVKKVLQVPCEVGRTYLLEFEALTANGGVHLSTTGNFADLVETIKSTGQSGRISHEFTASQKTMYLLFYQHGDVPGEDDAAYDNIHVIDKADIERADYVFLEVWHEKIRNKDVVYPFGNVQYGANSYSGITLEKGLVVQPYSAFGDWDNDTQGYGVRWSSLNAEQKHLFVGDAFNNIYNDGGELVQVRYRVRVVKGADAVMYRSEPLISKSSDNQFLAYHKNLGSAVKTTIRARGRLTDSFGDHTGVSSTSFSCMDRVVQYPGHFRLCQWKTGKGWIASDYNGYAHHGLCLAVPIALVSRRNQGGYHNALNPLGTRGFANKTGGARRAFYETGNIRQIAQSVADCFDFASSGAYPFVDGIVYGHKDSNEGNIAAGGSVRPDGRRYDAIYPDDVVDLRTNAVAVSDAQRVLADSAKLAIAGSLRGSERGQRLGPLQTMRLNVKYEDGKPVYIFQKLNSYPFGASLIVKNPTSGKWHLFVADHTGSYTNQRFFQDKTGGFDNTGLVWNWGNTRDADFMMLEEFGGQSADGMLCCDIIGDPANYFRGHYTFKSDAGSQTVNTGDVVLVVDGFVGTGTVGHFYERIGGSNTFLLADRDYTSGTWKDLGTDLPGSWLANGVFGTPLLVHPDTGESLIPDGTPKAFKMSRKVRNVVKCLFWNGSDFVVDTPYWKALLESPANSRTISPPAGRVFLIFYMAEADGWEACENQGAVAIGDAVAMAEDGTTTHLANHLIGKTPDSLASYGLSFASAPLQRYAQNMHNSYLNKIGQQPEHQPLDIDPGNAGVALKVLPYLAEDKGRAYLHMLFKELRHDGTDWGDDARFKVVDGVSTMTDDNGKTVLVGQKRIPLPYFLKSEV